MKAPVLEIASAAALERRLSRTLRDLAAVGDKRAGTAAGAASATYIQDRMNAAGVGNVHLETFRFASFVLRGSAFRAGGRDLANEVLAYSGCGSAAAPLVHVGTGEPADCDGIDLSGRIALVERNVTFHRSAQYREAVARGAVGLVYISHAPQNLIQIGTVSDPEDGLGPIPALSVGERDGKDLIAAARAGGITAEIRIDAILQPATGRNVVGRLAGEGPPLLIGAHHDTWHVDSTDNGSGIAVLLELAERLAHEPRRRGAVLVAYDAEELGLFGGYDFLRKHVVEAGEHFAAFVNPRDPRSGRRRRARRGVHSDAGGAAAVDRDRRALPSLRGDGNGAGAVRWSGADRHPGRVPLGDSQGPRRPATAPGTTPGRTRRTRST